MTLYYDLVLQMTINRKLAFLNKGINQVTDRAVDYEDKKKVTSNYRSHSYDLKRLLEYLK